MIDENALVPKPLLATRRRGASEREIQIKFTTDAPGLRQALQSDRLSIGQKDRPRTTSHAIYFDTPLADLRRSSIILRIRRVRGKFYMGFKRWSPLIDGSFRRQAVELQVATPELDTAALGPDIASELERILRGQRPEPQFETIIKRLARTVSAGRSQVEVAFDNGTVIAGGRRQEFNEIELQLKLGDEASLYDLAVRASNELPLELETLSNADRGFILLSNGRYEPVRSNHLQLKPDVTLDETIGATIAASINHFTANWPAFKVSRHVESVHQMRVALRRLRAALRFYNCACPCADFEKFRSAASSIASALGQARDWDVFLDLIESGPMRPNTKEANFEVILQKVESHRKAGYEIAVNSVYARTAGRFVLDIHAFLAHHGWRDTLPEADRSGLNRPAREMAEDMLGRLHRRVLKRGRRPATLSAEERHRLRIAVKHVRYVSELFGSVFSARTAVQTYIRAVAELQDALGSCNDRIMAMRMLTELEDEAGPQGAKAVGFVIGWYSREAELVDRHLAKAWKQFRRTAVFWR
jgi:triphosphatase